MQFLFFHIWLSWENIIGGNTIVILLAHTPITDCQISKSVKSIIKFFVYLDFLYSTLLWNLLSLSERKWECARKKRKRGKIQFWTSYMNSQMDLIITSPHFLLLLLLYFIVVWAWACSTLVKMGLNKTIFKWMGGSEGRNRGWFKCGQPYPTQPVP